MKNRSADDTVYMNPEKERHRKRLQKSKEKKGNLGGKQKNRKRLMDYDFLDEDEYEED